MDQERTWRGKLTPGFQFCLGKVLPISVNRARRVRTSDFIGLFFLKGTLVQPKNVTGVSSCDTDGPWKVSRIQFKVLNSYFLVSCKCMTITSCIKSVQCKNLVERRF